MRPSLFLPLALFVALGCGGSGSNPVRTASQKAALRAISTVYPIYRKGASGPHRAIGSGHKVATRSIEADYDSDLKLWKTFESDGNTETTWYWSDAKATKPAGSKVVTITGSSPTSTHYYEETFTAGPLKGNHRVGAQTFTETGWTSHEVSTNEDGTTVWDEYSNDDRSGGSTRETTDQDGLKFTTVMIRQADQSSTLTTEIEAFKATFHANADGLTGTGSVVAHDPSESATFEAVFDDESGLSRTLTVHYADGMTETFGPEALAQGA